MPCGYLCPLVLKSGLSRGVNMKLPTRNFVFNFPRLAAACSKTKLAAGVLACCMASVVWAEPIGNANFSRVIRNNLSGQFELKENVYLNEGENGQPRSPWQPIEFFNGTLEGNGYVLYRPEH